MQLGQVGVWTSSHGVGGEENLGEAAQLAESLGYGTFWLGGSPRLPVTHNVLGVTTELTVATGIVNIWAYDPRELAQEDAELRVEFPDRLLLGVGIGHPEATSNYTKPLTSMIEFIDGLDEGGSKPEDRCIAALAPKMLQLSKDRTLGTHPYFIDVQHTKWAREQLGDGPLLAPEVACVIDTDTESARTKARKYAKLYLGLQNYTNNLKRFGYTDEDIADGGSDALIDAVVPHGSAEEVAAAVREHLDAGADHVCVQPVGGDYKADWTALAKELV